MANKDSFAFCLFVDDVESIDHKMFHAQGV